MSDQLTSLDEFLSARKDFVKSGDILLKANRAASSWNPEKRSMRFVMSAEVEDRDRDIVYQAGLNTERFMQNPVGFFNHRSYDRPHGTWSDLEKILNGRPKRTEGDFTVAPEGINPVADALALDMGAGLIKACSIGFIPKAVKKRAVPEDNQGESYYWPGYDVLEAELVECSPVTVPSNPLALAKMAKDGNALAREMIEEVLDTWAKDPVTGLLVPRKLWDEAWQKANGNMSHVCFMRPDDEPVATAMMLNLNKSIHPVEGEKDDQGRTGSGFQIIHHRNEDEPIEPKARTARTPPADEPAAKDDAEPGEADSAALGTQTPADAPKGLLGRLLRLFGGHVEPQVEQEIRAIEDELREQKLAHARQIVAEAERQAAEKAELQTQFQALMSRAADKGLV